MNEIRKYEPVWVEEPLWPHDDYNGLSKLNKIAPVAAGENEFSINQFLSLLEKDALTYYQPDVAKIGGITSLMDLVALFKAYNVEIAFHSRPHNGWVSTLASVNVAIGANTDAWIETPPFGIPLDRFTFEGKIYAEYIAPSGKGLSIVPKEPIKEAKTSKPLIFHS